MNSSLQDIARAIDALAPNQREELSLWLQRQYPQPIDEKLEADLHAGRLDDLIGLAPTFEAGMKDCQPTSASELTISYRSEMLILNTCLCTSRSLVIVTVRRF